MHVDVNLVDGFELDTQGFKSWRPEFADADFILEDGKYICGDEVEKMSKSKYNVVNPDILVAEFGADALRLHEMFLGPIEMHKPWNTKGISGVNGFLKKLWKLFYNEEGLRVSDAEPNKKELKALHTAIKKVTDDIERFSFNTPVSTFMICVNELLELNTTSRDILESLLILIAPYAPHTAEHLWSGLGKEHSIVNEAYPVINESYLIEDTKSYPVSFNGKKRFELEVSATLGKEEIEKIVLSDERSAKYLGETGYKKIIVVPGRIINIVV
jgi:leucyl-tRNA synthetase